MTTSRRLMRLLLGAGWAPAAVIVLHNLAAGIFKHEPYVDPIIHFLGGASMAFFIHAACRSEPKFLGAPSRFAVELISLGMTTVVGLCWELAELLADRTIGSHTQTSVSNTLRDLALDVLGAVAYLAVARLTTRTRLRQ
jgi:hypothetical protein